MPRYDRPDQSHDYVVTKYLEIMYRAYAHDPEDLSLSPRNEWRTFVKNKELRKEGRYFNVDDSIDSDDEEYEEYCKRCLKPNSPVVLYEDGAWKSRKIKEKYEYEISSIASQTTSNAHMMGIFPPFFVNTLSPTPVSNNLAEIAKLMLTSVIQENATTSTHNANDTFRHTGFERGNNIIKITKKETRERRRIIDDRRGE